MSSSFFAESFNKWFDTKPLQNGKGLKNKLRCAFSAGYRDGHIAGKDEGIQIPNAKAAFRAGINAKLSPKRFTYRNAGDVLGTLYWYLTKLDNPEHWSSKSVGCRANRENIADAINRIKLNYHLLRFLGEKKLIPEFKRWFYVNQEAPEAVKAIAVELTDG